jgi:hypothetical protein
MRRAVSGNLALNMSVETSAYWCAVPANGRTVSAWAGRSVREAPAPLPARVSHRHHALQPAGRSHRPSDLHSIAAAATLRAAHHHDKDTDVEVESSTCTHRSESPNVRTPVSSQAGEFHANPHRNWGNGANSLDGRPLRSTRSGNCRISATLRRRILMTFRARFTRRVRVSRAIAVFSHAQSTCAREERF